MVCMFSAGYCFYSELGQEPLQSLATFQNFVQTYEKGVWESLSGHVIHIPRVVQDKSTAWRKLKAMLFYPNVEIMQVLTAILWLQLILLFIKL